jgi:hypothetical protein
MEKIARSTHADDLRDDVAELVENIAGKTIVVPSEKMPAATGVAAPF